jgi:hypothetical protein
MYLGREEAAEGTGPLPNLHLSFSDLFTTEQTSVMQLEHCSAIGKPTVSTAKKCIIPTVYKVRFIFNPNPQG